MDAETVANRSHARAMMSTIAARVESVVDRRRYHMRLAPLVSSLAAGKGLYVPLIGSGVSSGAGIPTGFQIMTSLINRLATVEQKGQPESPIEWFTAEYGTAPTYPSVLEKLSATPGERSELLRTYIEPSEEDIANGRKVPTRAHAALAKLAKRGYVRLVLTTNFDALVESAMRQEGLDPLVVSRPDDIRGLRPLSHLGLCVVKLHGDYRDLRTLNSAEELDAYDGVLETFVARVLSDYGLIVCGWSAEFDSALAAIAQKNQSTNFGTYWAHRGPLREGAQAIIKARGAMVIPIPDADTFLHEVAEGVIALEGATLKAAVGAEMLLGRLKRYLQASDRWIDLEELVIGEADRVAAGFSSTRFGFASETFNQNNFVARALEYEAGATPLLRMLIAGAYWGRPEADQLWLSVVQRLVPDLRIAAGNTGWMDLADYPGLLGFYALGLGALAGRRPGLAVRALNGGSVTLGRWNEQEGPWIWRLHPWFLQDTNWFKWLPGLEHQRAPVSERVWQVLAPLFSDIALPSAEVERLFDEWELMLSLTAADLRERENGDARAPVGRYSWRQHDQGQSSVVERFKQKLSADGASWELMRAGLCGGDPARTRELLAAIESQPELKRHFGW